VAVFLDLETQGLARPGREPQRLSNLRLAVAVLLGEQYDAYEVYHESAVGELVRRLREEELVVGFGLRRFDYPILEGYVPGGTLGLRTLDILEDVEAQLGYRPSLDALARGTLGRRRPSTGLHAVRWWRTNQIDRVVSHCLEDVRITREIYGHGREHGFVVWASPDGKSRSVRVHW
jgi:DEAD/DEAH box helicase domain-containing protein